MKYLIVITLFLASCASQPVQKSNLTFANVKTHIKKGYTTQSEVIQLLGSPNITSKNRSGNEVWSYSKQSTRTDTGNVAGAGAGLGGGFAGIFGGSRGYNQSSANTFDLIITFDKKDIVQDYSVVSSQF